MGRDLKEHMNFTLGIASQSDLCQVLWYCRRLQEWRSEDWAKADHSFPSVHLTSSPRLQASRLPHTTQSVFVIQAFLSKRKWQGTPFSYFPFFPLSSNLCQVVQEVSPQLKDRSKISQKITSVVQSLKSSSHIPAAHLATTVRIPSWQRQSGLSLHPNPMYVGKWYFLTS